MRKTLLPLALGCALLAGCETDRNVGNLPDLGQHPALRDSGVLGDDASEPDQGIAIPEDVDADLADRLPGDAVVAEDAGAPDAGFSPDAAPSDATPTRDSGASLDAGPADAIELRDAAQLQDAAQPLDATQPPDAGTVADSGSTDAQACVSECPTAGATSCSAGVLTQCWEDPLGCRRLARQPCALGCGSAACATCDPIDEAVLSRAPINPGGDNFVNAYAELAKLGRTLFIASDNILEVFDLVNPQAPVRLTSLPGCHWPNNVLVGGNTLYVACFDTVLRFDVSAPSAPAPLPAIAITEAQDLFLEGERLFVAGRSGLTIYDLGVSASVPAGFLALPDLSAVTVAGRYALAGARTGISVIDISDISRPTLAGGTSGTLAQGYSAFQVSGGMLYASSTNPLGHELVSGLQIYDLAQLPQLAMIGSALPGQQADQMVVAGTQVFQVWQGLSVIDVAQPTVPRLLSQRETKGVADLVVDGDLVLIAGAGELLVLSAAKLSRTVFEAPGGVDALVANGAILYVGGRTLRTFDVRDPRAPVLLQEQAQPARHLRLFGDTLLARGSGAVLIYDVSNPMQPVLKAQVSDLSTQDFLLVGTLLILSSNDQLKLYDVSQLTAITPAGSHPLSAAGDLAYANGYLYAHGRTWSSSFFEVLFVPPAGPGSSVNLMLIDTLHGQPGYLTLAKGHLVLFGAKLSVFDLAAPTAPAKIFEADMGYFDRASFDGRNLLGTESQGSVARIVDLENPSTPAPVLTEVWLEEHLTAAISVGPYTYLGTDLGLRVIRRCGP